MTAAKIPIMPFTASSAEESTNKLSYPFGDPVTAVLATLPGVKAVGANRLAMLHLDVPAVGFFVDLVKKQAGRFGMKVAGDVPVAVTASDMTTYVAQALAAKASGDVHDRRSVATVGDLQAGPRPGLQDPVDLGEQRHHEGDDRKPAGQCDQWPACDRLDAGPQQSQRPR